MVRQLWFRFVALSLVFLLFSLALWPFPNVSEPLFVLAGISIVIATMLWIRKWQESRADQYSLASLNQMIREGTYSEEDVPEIDHDGDKFCLCCHTVYGTQFGVCPNCAKK
jgi:hypothetical protein